MVEVFLGRATSARQHNSFRLFSDLVVTAGSSAARLKHTDASPPLVRRVGGRQSNGPRLVTFTSLTTAVGCRRVQQTCVAQQAGWSRQRVATGPLQRATTTSASADSKLQRPAHTAAEPNDSIRFRAGTERTGTDEHSP